MHDSSAVHPYTNLPARQFWSRAVARDFTPGTLANLPPGLVRHSDKIASMGSCFAANLVPYLERKGFQYLRTEYQHPLFRHLQPENMSYGKFSAGYGNIYTARQMVQLLARSLGEFKPDEDCWITDDGYIDPFRPGLRYFARSQVEFDLLTAQHLNATRQVFSTCDTLIVTMGLTEAWVSSLDGAVFPACPGTIAGSFDPERHQFVNFTVMDVIADLRTFLAKMQQVNPNAKVIFTVSPVPLVATATESHVLTATIYSKSVLRVAVETVCQEFANTFYFPAYEIVTGPQAPVDFFEADRRNVTRAAVDTVMAAFFSFCDDSEAASCPPDEGTAVVADMPADTVVPTSSKPDSVNSGNSATSLAQTFSAKLAEIECEEAGQISSNT